MRIEIDPDIQDGEITIDAVELWWLLDEQQQEDILRDNAHWGVVERALEDQLGLYYAGPSYYPSIHKLREKILTDPSFVGDMIVEFIRSLLKKLADAEEDQRKAEKAFWDLYRKVKKNTRHDMLEVNTPHSFGKGEHIWIKSKEIKKEILENFRKLLKEYANEQ